MVKLKRLIRFESNLKKKKVKKRFFIFKKLLKYLLLFSLLFLTIYLIFGFFVSPEKNETTYWEFGQELQAKIYKDIKNRKTKGGKEKEVYVVENLRDFDWTKEKKDDIKKYKKFEFNLSEIKSVDLLVSHFAKQEFIAHVFMIFNLKNKKNFGISIESRQKNTQDFSLLGGFWYKYNLIYIVATEKDLISLREKRKERLYRYRMNLTEKESQELFLNLAERVNGLLEKPKFYNTIFTNCTNLLIEDMQKVKKFDFPILEKYLLPGYTDKALYQKNILDKTEYFHQSTWEDFKRKHLIISNND